MADVMPNYKVEQQRLRARIAEQRAQIEGQTLAILEMADRKARHEGNIDAARRAIEEMETQLASLAEAHGELTSKEIAALAASVDAPAGASEEP